jgi:hypothetical protein
VYGFAIFPFIGRPRFSPFDDGGRDRPIPSRSPAFGEPRRAAWLRETCRLVELSNHLCGYQPRLTAPAQRRDSNPLTWRGRGVALAHRAFRLDWPLEYRTRESAASGGRELARLPLAPAGKSLEYRDGESAVVVERLNREGVDVGHDRLDKLKPGSRDALLE